MASKESAVAQALPFPLDLPTTRWWTKDTIAIVTGGNRGIGFALVKRLAELGLTVVLTARDSSKGKEAVEALKSIGLSNNVHFFPLDVSNPSSITRFVSWFEANFSALDILINNAGVSFNDIDENSVEYAEIVIRTNFYGPKLLTEALLPIFRRSSSVGRIINISSRLGLLNKLQNPSLRKMLMDENNLSEMQIEKIVTLFLEDVKNGTWKNGGWPHVWTDYAVSKLALNAYSVVLAKRYKNYGISVNCYCPGFTQTSMTKGKGKYTTDDAAKVAVNIALLPPQILPTGRFFTVSNSCGTFSKL
ncbi:OLC1v1008153C1 [Oldenlandia corymbosa var. corymbosa]|uniref:OLC1v1008153C1 n=1 Tax=Oldenlandia corymbosa var. corymbosa TaxID=529605 RepID=A0AAV1DL37_OLDCO|nr:OLC1v1008153C1 [Oldenlandia corymbosa var. corymbosa]